MEKIQKKSLSLFFRLFVTKKQLRPTNSKKIFFLDETFSFFFIQNMKIMLQLSILLHFIMFTFIFCVEKSSLWDFLKEPTKNLQKTYSKNFQNFQNFKKSEIFILNFFFGFFVKIKIILIWKCSAWAVLSIYWFTFFIFIHIWNEKLEITRPILFMFFL